MTTLKFWYCEIDRMNQRTGNYYPVGVPTCLVIKESGFYYLGVDLVHNTGVIEKHAFLYTSEEQAQRAALS